MLQWIASTESVLFLARLSAQEASQDWEQDWMTGDSDFSFLCSAHSPTESRVRNTLLQVSILWSPIGWVSSPPAFRRIRYRKVVLTLKTCTFMDSARWDKTKTAEESYQGCEKELGKEDKVLLNGRDEKHWNQAQELSKCRVKWLVPLFILHNVKCIYYISGFLLDNDNRTVNKTDQNPILRVPTY